MERRMLTLAEREEISRGLAEGLQGTQIAQRIGRNKSVVSREIGRHGGNGAYRAHRADRAARKARRRPKPRKLDGHRRLREHVIDRLRHRWSPEQVAGRLRYERGCADADRVVSHEAIYTWIYALPKGELAELGIMLRSGRTARRPRGRAQRGGPGARVIGMVSIDQRSAEVEGRQVPGHWEGDLIIGRNTRTAMGTLVERTTRFYLPVPLGSHKTADDLAQAVITTVGGIPDTLRKSLTWDQGTEMARHAAITLATDMPIYFAHPHAPWERGTNENTNRLLREYYPRGTDITDDPNHHQRVAAELNNRPRRILGWRTPNEAFLELLASDVASTS